MNTVVMNLPLEQKMNTATATASLWGLNEWIFSEAKDIIVLLLKPR